MRSKTLFCCISISLIFSVKILSQDTDPKMTEAWDPVPKVVTPGKNENPPSDAIVLFNGKNLDAWQNPQFKGEPTTSDGVEKVVRELDNSFKNQPAGWIVKDGNIIVKPGNGAIETKQKFGSFQLHIEWMAPVDEGKTDQAYSNSGIFLAGLYEIQVLNSYINKTYSNGQAGSIYKQYIPLVNACLPPGEWQSYDIIFTAPQFDGKGQLISPAKVTAFQNGVLIQNNVELKGPTVFIGKPRYVAHPEKMPLRLQDHGNPVSYRNIWIREL